METINQRFKIIINKLFDNNKSAFSKHIGVNPTVIENVVGTRGGKPSYDVIQKICANANISARWLLMGEGEMMTEKNLEIKQIHHSKSLEKEYDEQQIILYDFEAAAGLRSLLDNKKSNVLDYIRIPNMPKCDGAIHITGDSMYPLLKSGDIVLYKEMPLEEQSLFFGEMYLLSYEINGDDYVVCKYIKKSEQGMPYITLASQNPNHADRDISFRSVNALALIKASIRINSML